MSSDFDFARWLEGEPTKEQKEDVKHRLELEETWERSSEIVRQSFLKDKMQEEEIALTNLSNEEPEQETRESDVTGNEDKEQEPEWLKTFKREWKKNN